ncbi:MAG: (4Fe-4S)-binding protein [Gemmatimonadetes bacterium]|nr:(4Fe-4S)-binding protein [Gemmatimonadota bacterium]MBP6670133.1 (4Fe-4S)-binding protein [Gemmatimonadales bacterium]MBK6781466.1 (4Fe-4S)-binding protein [Gemmatimonadota bacterium]MBK7349893.1 (4Fe-4S)-binding protein [Gemmatimonadota bacterium]MBK7717096.1 (4Fe-4S)-binding protein [Gemmatimonadota bacterium]
MPKPLQVVHTADIAVTFDPNICRHAGECIRGLPKVFDVSRPDWIHPGAAWPEEILAVVARCPSGALQAVRAGLAPQKPVDLPLAGVSVNPSKDGPIIIKGPVMLEYATGKKEKRSSAIALCRCGQTGSSPFCDGSHNRVGFTSRDG